MKDTIQKYHLTPIFCLLLVLVFFYFPVLFFGRTLQGPEMARMNQKLKAPPTMADIFKSKVDPQILNTEQATAAYQRYPNDILLGKMIHSFELPLWNSHQGLGIPFAAQYETSAFSPIRILQDFFPTSARDGFFILHMWLAGIFTYLFFIRGSKVSRMSAFFGACLYMGSGVFSWFMQMEDYMSTAMMLPLLMLSVHLLTERNTARKIAFVAIISALTLLAGQPEVAFYCFVLSSSYFLFKTYSTGIASTARAKLLMSFFFATILGIMLASPLLLLFFELLKHAFTIHSSTLHVDTDMIAGVKARTPFFLLPSIFLPSLLDFPIMPLVMPAAASWDFLGSYIGIIPVYFWFAGLFLKQNSLKKDFLFFSLFAFAFLMMDLGLWPFNLIGYLPLFRQAWSPRWGGDVWSFSLITAATYGFYFLQTCNLDQDKWKKLLKRIAAWTGVVLYICVAIAYSGQSLQNAFIFSVKSLYNPMSTLFITMAFSIASLILINQTLQKEKGNRHYLTIILTTIISLWYYLPRGNFLLQNLFSSFSMEINFLITKLTLLILSFLFLLSFLVYLKKKIRLSILLSTLSILVFCLYSMMTWLGYPVREPTQETTPFINYLQKTSENNRFFAFDGIIMPMYASAYGLYDPRFMTALSYEPYQYFAETYIKAQSVNDSRQWFDANQYANAFNFNELSKPTQVQRSFAKAMNITSVKYFITNSNQDLNWIKENYPSWSTQLSLIYSDTDVHIFENKAALPRTFLVSQYTYVDNYQKAQALAMSDQFDLLHNAVLTKNLPNLSNTSTLTGNATIEKYTDNRVTIGTSSNENALLVLTDIDYPGWQATVDNKKSEILNVDGLIRGVIVPKGQHRIVFYYYPKSLQWAVVFFISALCACLLLILIEIK